MKLSTKVRYGTRALLDISLHQEDGLVPLKEIAQRQQISLAYLEHLISPLIAGGVIRSMRGIGGGVALNRPPGEIRLSEVVELLQGSTAPLKCVDDPMLCSRAVTCVMRDVWGQLKESMDQVLESITLQDLMERHNVFAQPMYQI